MADEIPYSAPPDLSDSNSDDNAEEGDAPDDSMPNNGDKKNPLPAGAPAPSALKPLAAGCHKTGEHAPGLYIYTNACSEETHMYAGKTFLRVPSSGVSPSVEFPYGNHDVVTRFFAKQNCGKADTPQVTITNPSHHVHTRASKIDVAFNMAQVLATLDGSPASEREMIPCTSVAVFQAGSTELPFSEAFDLRAAAASLRRTDEGSTSDSHESAHERNDSDRTFGRFAYGAVVMNGDDREYTLDAAMAARAVTQGELSPIPMERVMMVSARLGTCHHSFPYPLRLHMKGVKCNFWSHGTRCAAVLMPDGSVLTAEGGGVLTLESASCSSRELASFMSMDPEREMKTIFHQEQYRDPERREKYYLTPMMTAFVKYGIIPEKMRKYRAYSKVRKALARVGISINEESSKALAYSATTQGLNYLLKKGHALRATMPFYRPCEVIAYVEPDVPGGWRGLAEIVGRDGYSPSLLAACFRVHVPLEVKFVSPNAHYERGEAFAQCMRDLQLKENPPPVFVPPPMPSAPAVVLVPASLQQYGSQMAYTLAAAAASSGSAKEPPSSRSKRGRKKGRGRKGKNSSDD